MSLGMSTGNKKEDRCTKVKKLQSNYELNTYRQYPSRDFKGLCYAIDLGRSLPLNAACGGVNSSSSGDAKVGT